MVRLLGTIAMVLLISAAIAQETAAIDPTPQTAAIRAPSIGPA